MKARNFLLTAFSVALAAGGVPLLSQEVLPKPEPPFKGKIGRTYKNSQLDRIPVTRAPDGAPNVLVVLIDDVGYGTWSTFGGQIPPPNLDRLANMGLRYTRFHTTAMSSPTRAALLTGRNHHSVGTGIITEFAEAFPGYSSRIPKSAAMILEILRQNGYSTAWFGKNHNVPDWETSTSGPYDHWPTEPLPPGPNVIRVEFRYDGGGLGKGGMATLFANDRKVGEGRLDKTASSRFTGEGFDIGEDTGSPVSQDYSSPNRFIGTIKKVVIDTKPMNLTAAERETIHRAENNAWLASQ